MRTSDAVSEITGALVLANAELRNPSKDAKGQVRGNPRYTYASLPAILDDVRPVLTANGIAAVQEDVTTSEGIGVVTRLLHVSGQWLEFGPLLMPVSSDAQANGSILTYCRRYQLTAALGLAPDEDDDGRSAASSPAAAVVGGPVANVNAGQGSVTSPRDADGARAAQHVAPPTLSASDQETRTVATGSDRETRTDGAPAGDAGTIAVGAEVESSTPAGAPTYLSKDDQALLGTQYGSKAKALLHYKKRYGERLNSVADITYAMRDEMEAIKA